MIVEQDAVPSSKMFIDKVKNYVASHSTSVQPVAQTMVHSHNPFVKCINCNGQHKTAKCDRPKADCDACGPKAGHLREHCLVINKHKTIPDYVAAPRRAFYEHQRKLYHRENACPPCADTHVAEASPSTLRAYGWDEWPALSSA